MSILDCCRLCFYVQSDVSATNSNEFSAVLTSKVFLEHLRHHPRALEIRPLRLPPDVVGGVVAGHNNVVNVSVAGSAVREISSGMEQECVLRGRILTGTSVLYTRTDISNITYIGIDINSIGN